MSKVPWSLKVLNVSPRTKWAKWERSAFLTPMDISNFYPFISSCFWLNHSWQIHFCCGDATEFTLNTECSEFTCICTGEVSEGAVQAERGMGKGPERSWRGGA